MTDPVNVSPDKAGKKTLRVVAIFLGIYYLYIQVVQFHTYSDHIRFFDFKLVSALFLINLFYLPFAIVLTFMKKSGGWLLLSIWLIFFNTSLLFTLLADIIKPRELYHHPDAFWHTTWAQIYLFLTLPLIGMTFLLWLTQRSDVLTFYAISPAMRKKVFIYTIAAALLLGSYSRFVSVSH